MAGWQDAPEFTDEEPSEFEGAPEVIGEPRRGGHVRPPNNLGAAGAPPARDTPLGEAENLENQALDYETNLSKMGFSQAEIEPKKRRLLGKAAGARRRARETENRPETPWSQLPGEASAEIGRQIETGIAGTQEAIGATRGHLARLDVARQQVVPQAVAEQKQRGGLYWEQPSVVAAANELGIRPDQFFPSDWEKYLRRAPAAAEQRITEGTNLAAQMGELEATGRARREKAAQVGEMFAPNLGSDFSAKNILFQAATSLPQTVAGVGAGIVHPALGAAVFGGTAFPQFYAQAKDKGVDNRGALSFAALMTASEGLTELPLIEVVTRTPAGQATLQRLAGQYAESVAGKTAGAAATEGVMEGLNQAIQIGIQDGTFDENTSLGDALTQIAQAGLVGAVSGGTVGGAAAAAERVTRPRGFEQPNLGATQTTETSFGGAPQEGGWKAAPEIPESPPTPDSGSAAETTRLQPGAEAEKPGPSLGFQDQPESATPEQQHAQELIDSLGGIEKARAYQEKLRKQLGPTVTENREGLNLDQIDAALGIPPRPPAPKSNQETVTRRVALPDESPEKYAPAEEEDSSQIPNNPPAKLRHGGLEFEDHEDGGFTVTYTNVLDGKQYIVGAADVVDGKITDLNIDPSPEMQGLDKSLRQFVEKRISNVVQAEVAGQPVEVAKNPTPAQRKAGNYKKGHIQFQGIDVAIENPKGSERPFTRPNGKQGIRVMQDDYGYVKRSEGADGDAIDVFIGPNKDAPNAYVIDQLTPDGRDFDEHKAIVGVDNEEQARELYLRNYQKGWKGLGAITPISMERFKIWAQRGAQKEPLAWVPGSDRNQKLRQPQYDSLLEFIAKTRQHGAKGMGLSIDAMSKEGLDPADMRTLRGTGITRPFTKNGGASLDAMAEVAAEHGYPVTDEKGNYSANKLLEAISREMAGNPVYSTHKEFGTPEEKRRAQLESFMQTYEPTEKLFDLTDQALDHYIDMLSALEQESNAEPSDQVMFSRGKPPAQADLFGDPVAIKNELQRLIAEKDRRRNTGQESPETGKPGDLFSQANQQTDLTDQAAQKAADEKRVQEKEKKRQYQQEGEHDAQVGDGRVRWINKDGTAYVIDIHAGNKTRGRAILEWLGDTTENDVFGLGVVDDAVGFWKKMQEQGISSGYSDENFTKLFPSRQMAKPATQRAVVAPSTTKSATTELVDAGEKIGGARKDLWASRGMMLSDLENMTDAEAATLVNKAAVWKPDYAAVIEAGVPRETAAGVKVLWDKLAAKPTTNTPEGRRQYITGLTAVRKVLSEARTEDDLSGIQEKVANELGFSWRSSSRERQDKDGYHAFWAIMKGRRSSLGWGYSERQSVKKMIEAGFPNAEPWTRVYKVSFEYGRGLTENGIAVYVKRASEAGTPLDPATIKEGFFTVRKKDGGAVGYAHTKEGAEAIAKERYEGTDRKKDALPERPHLDTVTRVGKAVRSRDATSQDFVKDLGFRGIEFGNWAANDERQKLVNLAYDALHDLAMVLKIPPDALSLDGRLGLALGARGVGRAAAHYEPGKLVINMTKLSGAGSLAHEWGHAMDHYFGELERSDAYTTGARGASGWYDMPRLATNQNLRPEMQSAFRALMGAMFQRDRTRAEAVRERELMLERFEDTLARYKKMLADNKIPERTKDLETTVARQEERVRDARGAVEQARKRSEGEFGKVDTDFRKNAINLSGKSGASGYWARPTEMLARAFESYVFDKLKGQQLTSEYLVHGVEAERFANHSKGNPYPAGMDRERINAAFDHLFDTIKQRGGEKSTVLFHTEKELGAAAFGKKVKEELGLEQLDLHMAHGDLKVDLILVGREKRKQGLGTRAMELLTQYADERGLRIILSTAEKDDAFGTTSSARLKKFYKRFGFFENRGRNKDYTIRDNMVRLPITPETGSVTVKEDRATYSQVQAPKETRQPPIPGFLDIFAATNNQNAAKAVKKGVDLASRTALVSSGTFSTGITKVKSASDAAHILAPVRKQAQENMLALVLDKDGKPLAVIRHSVGTIDSASVSAWAMNGAILSIPGAKTVWYAHQHPSGVIDSSTADRLVTERLGALLKGTGVTSSGMLIFAPGSKKATFTIGDSFETQIGITPAPRRKTVPLMERKLVKISPLLHNRPSIQSINDGRQYVASLKGRTGLVLLDMRHSVLGFLDMSDAEMQKLRSDDPNTGAGKVLAALHEANAAAVIVAGSEQSIANMYGFMKRANASMLDGFYKTGDTLHSYAEQGLPDNYTYAHRVREADVVPGAMPLEAAPEFERQFTDASRAWAYIQLANFTMQKGQTAHLAQTVYVPAESLTGLKETRGEFAMRQDNIDELVNAMRVNGYDQRTPILVTVDGKGQATIFDGNHRARAAAQLGMQDVPVRVVYLNGGEEADGKFSPEALGSAAMASADRAPVTNNISRRGAVEQAVRRQLASYNTVPEFKVVQSFRDLPTFVFQRIGGFAAMRSGVNAFIDFTPAGPTMYFIADRIRSDQHAAEIVAHEMTHYGLETVLSGEEWSAIAQGVLRDQKARVQAIVKGESRTIDLKNPRDQALVVHEVLAYLNEKKQVGKAFDPAEETIWRRLMRAIRQFFHSIGLTGPAYTEKYISEWLDTLTARMRSPRIQAGKGDAPGFVNMNPLKNQTPPPFYSATLRAVQGMKQEKASADQWWNTLKNRPGIKPEELQWLGLEEWLKSQEGPVTRAALEDFVRANEIVVKDVTKLANSSTSRSDEIVVELSALGYSLDRDMDGTLSGIETLDGTRNFPYDPDEESFLDDDGNSPPDEVVALAREFGESWDMDENPGESQTRYRKYTLPGGENYREVLLTLPERDKITVNKVKTARGWGDTEGGDVGIERRGDEGNDFRLSHWSEPNVLVHFRLDDRADKDGKRVLFVEEIQSDWHQEGRKRGYRGDPVEPLDTTGWTAKEGEGDPASGPVWEVRSNEGRWVLGVPRANVSGPEEAIKRAAADLQRRLFNNLAVPDAPFKTSWPELALKRILRMAAEEGYDRIAWTTGNQQNQRYKKEHTIARIVLSDNSSGSGVTRPSMEGPFEKGNLTLIDTDGRKVMNERWTHANELVDLIGQELTDKLLAAPAKDVLSGLRVRQRELTGLNVKIGGEGMRGFYDEMLPSMVNRITKKWGGKAGEVRLQKTTGIDMPTKAGIISALMEYRDSRLNLDELSQAVGVTVNESDVENIPTDPYKRAEARLIASDIADELLHRGKGQPGALVHGLDITDQMRQAALQGLPLFHRETQAQQQDNILTGGLSLEEDKTLSRAWNWLVFRAQDKFNDVLRLQEQAKKYREDMAIPEKLDAYMRETLYHGRTEYRFEQYDKTYVQPLLKMVKTSGYTYDQVEQFLYARHAPEANAHIKKITTGDDLFEDNQEWHSGMTDEQAAAKMAELEKAGDIRKLWQIGVHVDRMTKFRRDLLVSEGLETALTVGAWEAQYKHYVPLQGWADKPEKGRMPKRGKGYDTGGRITKRRTGRKTLAGNILATLVAQAQATMIMAEKAKVGRAFLDFAKTHPSDLYEVDQVEMERYFDAGSGTVKERPVFRGGLPPDNLLRVKVDGKDHWIEFNEDDPQAMRMARAFKNLSSKEINGLLSFLLGVNRVLATVNTSLNPEFVVSNLFRDLQTAMVNMQATDAKGLQAQVLADWRKAFAGIMSGEFGKGQHEWTAHFDDFKRLGAKTGWIDFRSSPADLEQDLRAGLAENNTWNVAKKGVKTVLKVVDRTNLAVENAIRLSVFVNARRNGLSDDKAAELAKNLTINFNRKGDWGTELNALYLFYNAAAQGSAVLWNVMKNKHARRVLYGLAALAIAMQPLNRIIGGDDDDEENRYDKIPEYERASNFIIMLPKSWRWKLKSGDEVDHLKIPMPYGYNMVYYTGAMAGDILDYNFFGFKHHMNSSSMAVNWLSEFIGAWNPLGSNASLIQTMAPTIADPVIALYENQTWYGGNIHPEAHEFDVPAPNSELYYRSASDISKLVAHTLNQMTGGTEVTPGVIDIHPNDIDYVVEQVFGGLGRFAENMGRTGLNLLASPDKIDVSQVPFARRVLGQTGNRYISDTYYAHQDKVRYLEKERGAMGQLEMGTPARVKKEQYIAANYATAEKAYTEAKRAEGQISRLRKEKRALQEHAGSTLERTRQERIKAIDAEIEKVMDEFNQQWNLIEDATRAPTETRGTTGRIAPLIEGKTKPEAVAAVRKAGMPAMAALMDSMPFRPRAAMAEKYRKELVS